MQWLLTALIPDWECFIFPCSLLINNSLRFKEKKCMEASAYLRLQTCSLHLTRCLCIVDMRLWRWNAHLWALTLYLHWENQQILEKPSHSVKAMPPKKKRWLLVVVDSSLQRVEYPICWVDILHREVCWFLALIKGCHHETVYPCIANPCTDNTLYCFSTREVMKEVPIVQGLSKKNSELLNVCWRNWGHG